MRLNERSSVVLPQPDGPISAVTFLFSNATFRFFSTRWLP